MVNTYRPEPTVIRTWSEVVWTWRIPSTADKARPFSWTDWGWRAGKMTVALVLGDFGLQFKPAVLKCPPAAYAAMDRFIRRGHAAKGRRASEVRPQEEVLEARLLDIGLDARQSLHEPGANIQIGTVT